MTIVEFIEEVMDCKLLDYQKKLVIDLYELYKKDELPTTLSMRGQSRFDLLPIYHTLFSLYFNCMEDTNMKKERIRNE